MRKDSARGFGEELVVVVPVGEQRRRQGQRLRLVPDFIRRRPIGAPGIERIEDEVAAGGRVELGGVFERRIVDDRGVAAGLDLRQHLPDQRGLPGAGVAHDEDMTRLDRTRDAHGAGGPKRAAPLDEADAVRPQPTVEPARRDEFRPLQPSPVAAFTRPREVHRHRDRQPQEADDDHAPSRGPQQRRERLIAIDPVTEKEVQLAVRIRGDLPHEPPVAGPERVIR